MEAVPFIKIAKCLGIAIGYFFFCVTIKPEMNGEVGDMSVLGAMFFSAGACFLPK